MTPSRLCDLLHYWILDGRSEADMNKTQGMLEMPPPGYVGSLRGTVWDHDVMVSSYRNQGG